MIASDTPDMLCSTEAESTIVGLALQYPDALARLRATGLAPEHFGVDLMRRAWKAIVALDADGREVNIVTVVEQLKRTGAYREGDVERLITCSESVWPTLNADALVEIVRRKACRRWLRHLAARISQRVEESDESEEQLLMWLEEAIGRASARIRPGRPRELVAWDETLTDTRHMLDRIRRGHVRSVPTGIPEIDAHLDGGGLLPQQFVVVAARPGCGKTAFGLDIAADVARRGGRVFFFSLEMGREQLVKRLLAPEAEVARSLIRHGMTDFIYERLRGALERLAGREIWIDDTSRTIGEIVRSATRASARVGRPDLIVVDYIQLVDSGQSQRPRNEQVGAVSNALKLLARELDTPLLALSQLSRRSAHERREPDLHDLRDSGQIEQDADVVLLMWSDAESDPRDEYREVALKCAKQRDGEMFRATLVFCPRYVTFRRAPVEVSH